MTESEISKNETDQASGASPKRRGALVLRVVIYGGLLAFLCIICFTLFFPVAEPAAVRRAAQTKPNPAVATIQNPALSAAPSSPYGATNMAEPLFDAKKSGGDPSQIDRMNGRFDEIQKQIGTIEQKSINEPYKTTMGLITNLGYELQSRVWEILSSLPNADDKLKAYRRIARLHYELMQREEEHYVRHGRWASAAELCAMQGERMKAIYYWQRAGGPDGRIKAVLTPLGYFPSRKFYPVTLPEEDATAIQFFVLPAKEVPYKLWLQWRAEDGIK